MGRYILPNSGLYVRHVQLISFERLMLVGKSMCDLARLLGRKRRYKE